MVRIPALANLSPLGFSQVSLRCVFVVLGLIFQFVVSRLKEDRFWAVLEVEIIWSSCWFISWLLLISLVCLVVICCLFVGLLFVICSLHSCLFHYGYYDK